MAQLYDAGWRAELQVPPERLKEAVRQMCCASGQVEESFHWIQSRAQDFSENSELWSVLFQTHLKGAGRVFLMNRFWHFMKASKITPELNIATLTQARQINQQSLEGFLNALLFEFFEQDRQVAEAVLSRVIAKMRPGLPISPITLSQKDISDYRNLDSLVTALIGRIECAPLKLDTCFEEEEWFFSGISSPSDSTPL